MVSLTKLFSQRIHICPRFYGLSCKFSFEREDGKTECVLLNCVPSSQRMFIGKTLPRTKKRRGKIK